MRRTVMNRLIILMVALVLPVSTFGAEPVRMKYALSVSFDEKGVGLKQPEGVACSKERLVVADTGNGRLVLYTMQNGEVKGGKEVKSPQMLYPQRVIMSSKGDLFVLDGRLRKILRFSQEGAYTGFFEPADLPTQGMIVPAGIGMDDGDNLYLLDILGGRVLVLSPEGKFQRQIAFPKEYGFMTDLAVEPKGTVFVIDGVKSAVYSNATDPGVLSQIGGTLKEDLKFPSNVTTDKRGSLYISDQNGGGIVVVGQDGQMRNRLFSLGWKEGAVRYPSQTCIDQDGVLFVTDRENNRIEEFTPLK